MSAGGIRVLLVEDDPAILHFLRNTLRVQGYDVVEATNGREGLDLVRQAKPELLILDHFPIAQVSQVTGAMRTTATELAYSRLKMPWTDSPKLSSSSTA